MVKKLLVENAYSTFDRARRSVSLARAIGPVAWFHSARLFPIVMPFTMVGRKRLEALFRLATLINRDEVPGDIVECGTCNGGTAAVLGAAGLAGAPSRRLWLFDSFEGLPPSGDKDGQRARGFTGKCLGQEDAVKEVLAKAGVPPEQVKIVKGWFEDTFDDAAVPRIALLHCDADWYESVRLTLRRFYDLVEPGGYVVFDDYGFWEGCRKAVDEFMAERRIGADLIVIDTRAVYFQKPKA